jgi:hypothetical protein
MVRILAFLIAMYSGIHTAGAQIIQPIDSTYLHAFPAFGKNVNNIKGKVWPGMTIGPACIFRLHGPAFLTHHPQPPADAKLVGDSIYMFPQADYAIMGTSQTEINKHLTAHNNYGQTHYVSVNQFYAELFHELHHVYQRTHIKQLKFDNPADLLTYPEDYRNDAVHLYENELLLEMLSASPKQLTEYINKFYSCRMLRKNIIGDKYANYEKNVESSEGPSTYCEYMYMKEFASTAKEKEYINKRFYYTLVEPAYGREGLRNRFLLSGMVQCILLSKTFKNWQTEYYASGLTLNDFFFSKFKPHSVKLPALTDYETKAKYFTALEKEKHKNHLDAFHSQNGIKISITFKEIPQLRGLDPMHAEAVSDSLVLHSTLLKLAKGSNYLTIANKSVATYIHGQIWNVKKVTLFVPESSIRIDQDAFICNEENATIRWKYISQEKKGNEYIVMLE